MAWRAQKIAQKGPIDLSQGLRPMWHTEGQQANGPLFVFEAWQGGRGYGRYGPIGECDFCL